MAKGPHRGSQRIVLPNGMWVLLYDDGESVKIGGYDRAVQVNEVLNRDGGAHVFMRVTPTADTPRETQRRASDLVTVPREVYDTLRRAAGAQA